jgi:O-antigen ligase
MAVDPRRAWPALATLAVAVPPLIAFNLPPSATFFNQDMALFGWGLFLAALALTLPASAWRPRPTVAPALAAFAIVLLAAFVSPFWTGLPWALAWSAVGVIAAAMVTLHVAAAASGEGSGERAFAAFCIGLVIAGIASACIGIVQVYAPAWADGDWIARAALPGRASGNLRQPNHLSSLLLWSLVALVWLAENRRLGRSAALALGLVMLFVVVLTGSRTGAIGALMMAVWGALDRRLTGRTRIALLLVPVGFFFIWLGLTEWAHHNHQVFTSEARFTGKGDISASRFRIWANTFALIEMHPWLGVGFGEFNFAWTLTPFPGRPVAFFDHTHNLPLQLAVELGLPLAAVVMVLLGWGLVLSFLNAWKADGNATAPAPVERSALVMVLMVTAHSQFEYPLWYAYFLLPAAFAWGACLGQRTKPLRARATDPVREPTRPLLLASMVMVLVAIVALWDYARVVAIFAPPEGAGSLEERIEEGRHSWFFAPHAEYAAATTPEHPSTAMPAFSSATHYLLDARLTMAWARALAEAGDEQRARYVAQRLREFHNEASESFFAPCADTQKPAAELPFQCKAPTRAFRYEDFR